MCYVIKADCILANLFAAGKHRITIRELNEVRIRLERAIAIIYIDVSTQSICAAIEKRPNLFDWLEDDVVVIHDEHNKLTDPKYLEALFNWRIPKEHRRCFVETIREFRVT